MAEIELLAPAGNRECLETAFYFGADAVYLAGKQFGLRAFASNFDDADMKAAVTYAHQLGKKLYVTVNAILYNSEAPELAGYLKFLESVGVDGLIFSDPAVLQTAKQNKITTPLHLSTQASTTNYLAAAFWHEQGVRRIVMSRETTLSDIAEVGAKCPSGLELEVFVHGAMCIAHSGRCLLSTALTNRSGNRGECAQPCRWEYYLHEEGYEGEYFQISEDQRGTYVLNSKDLMMIAHIPALVQAGVTSFKVEGRMKSAYYVASVIGAYRRAIDAYLANPDQYQFDPALEEELVKSASRGFTTGFFFGNPREHGQDVKRDIDLRKYTFVAKVLEPEKDGMVLAEQRNKFCIGERVEVLSPNSTGNSFVIENIQTKEGEQQQSAPHPQQHVYINCPFHLQPGDILRREDL